MTGTVRRLLPFAAPYRRALLLGTLLTLGGVAIGLAEPWPLRWVVDGVLAPTSGVPPEHPHLILAIAVGTLLALVVVGSVVTYWSSRLLSAAGLHLANDLRIAVLGRLQRQSLRYHQQHRVGDLTARVTTDVGYTQDMIVSLLSTLVPNVLLVIGMFVVMMLLDPAFTLLALAATPPLAWATHRSRVRLRLAARQVRKTDGRLASAATEDLSAIHLVQAFTLERDRLGRFSALCGSSLSAGLESVRLQSRFGPLVDLASIASTGVVLWFGASQVLAGRLSLGVLLVFVSYLGSLYKPMKTLAKLSQVVSKGAAAAERVLDVLDAPVEIVDHPRAVARTLTGKIEFRNVTFSYGREPVLAGLSFMIEPGEHVALVGPTGAGKSTIAALVPRLADVTSGAVLVDGLDVRSYRLESLRGQIATVLQDTVLLDGTLRENIRAGRPGASERDLARATELALVDEFVARLPDGLDTQVGERGATLSGGQRQRVAIARAILRDAKIIILDEPTSALDAASEELLVAAMDNLPAGRTRLVIAHRLSTIRDADSIMVLDHGRIVERGTHDDLVRAGGAYATLARFQTAPAATVLPLPARSGSHVTAVRG